MKKTYIALAASAAFAVAGSASAEGHGGSLSISANHQVQVVNIGYDDADNMDGLYMTDGGLGFENTHAGGGWNRININGERDLGNGMSAIFAVNSAQGPFGGVNLGGRKVFAGLSGDFGTVRLGRLNTPYVTGEPLQATFMQARGTGGRLGVVDGLGNGGYRDGVVRYDNSFGDISVSAALLVDTAIDYDDEDSQPSGDGNHAMSFSVSMPLGPVNAYLAHTAADNYTGWSTETEREVDDNGIVINGDTTPDQLGGEDQSLTKVGAVFSDGPIRAQFEYEMVDDGFGNRNAGNYMFLSGQYTLAEGSSVVLNYGMLDAEADGWDTNYMALGYLHSIGERTRVHVGYRQSVDDWDDETVTALGGGLRVSF